ncbi:MAG TPA: hypothetical protein VKV37_14625 [Ktedonobacteraceae bacterium]|jgi:hypothetical protein|nr:hypothetical protein [Ktedonobacteraceae bacterium]
MTMSEFNRGSRELGEDPSLPSMQHVKLPDDFSEEEVAFAKELGSLFSIEEEEMPPYFVQTLLEPDDPRYQPVEEGFEQKTYARVFRRLKLHRRLYRSHHAFMQSILPAAPLRRPLMALIAACLLIMVISMVVVSPSFANGLNRLLAGSHSGVIQVNSDPADGLQPAQTHPHQHGVRPPASESTQPRHISLPAALRELDFPMYMPDFMPTNYNLTSIYLYQEANQTWTDGPVVQLNYDFSLPGVSSHGPGQIAIREFKPVGSIYQVVQVGAAHLRFKDGLAAIEVDGQWERISQSAHQWVNSGRNELIYERDGVVFWIEGDQRDAIDGTVLFNIASSLQPVPSDYALHLRNHISDVSLASGDTDWVPAGEVLYIDSSNTGAPPLLIAADDSPQAILPPQKNSTRMH